MQAARAAKSAAVSDLRALYPGADERVYLDTAAVGLVSTRVRDAVTGVLDGHVAHGLVAAVGWTEMVDTDRATHQRLLDDGVRCSLRTAGVRFSHSSADLERVLAVLSDQ